MSRLRSSIYFRDRDGDEGLGMEGRSKAPLNLMMKSTIPNRAPRGVEPGKNLLDELVPLYRIYIDLSVRYEIRMRRSQPGT